MGRGQRSHQQATMTAVDVRSLALDGDDVVRPAWLDQGELGASAASAVGLAVELEDLIAAIESVSLKRRAVEHLNQWTSAARIKAIAADLANDLAEITMNFHRQRGDSVGNVATVATVLTERLTVAFRVFTSREEPVGNIELHDAILRATRTIDIVE
jgi:hypothetical protein